MEEDKQTTQLILKDKIERIDETLLGNSRISSSSIVIDDISNGHY